MAKVTHPGPVNPAQVIAAIPAAEGCTVLANDDAGTFDVVVPGVAGPVITATLASLVYDENIASVEDAMGEA